MHAPLKRSMSQFHAERGAGRLGQRPLPPSSAKTSASYVISLTSLPCGKLQISRRVATVAAAGVNPLEEGPQQPMRGVECHGLGTGYANTITTDCDHAPSLDISRIGPTPETSSGPLRVKGGLAPSTKGFKLVQGVGSQTSSLEELSSPVKEDGISAVITKFVAETLLPTVHGKFRLRGYKHSLDSGMTFSEPTAIIYGQPEGREDVVVRVHDACYTSEVLGSLKCDCAEQLQLALKMIQEPGLSPGLVIYLHQEGRGIGLANKIAAYALQERGLDTVEANRALGLPDDSREYTAAVNILKDLKIKSIRLMTNNPRKIEQLQYLGVQITDRVPCIVKAGALNEGYLSTKRIRMNHQMDGDHGLLQSHDLDPN